MELNGVHLADLIGGLLAGVCLVLAVPFGFRFTAPDANTLAWRRVWPAVGVVGLLALVLGRGGLGVGVALFYLAACAAFALSVPARLVRVRPLNAGEPAIAGALLSPLVGAGLLLADRLDPGVGVDSLFWVALASSGFVAGMFGRYRLADGRGAAAAAAALLGWAPAVCAVLGWAGAGWLALAVLVVALAAGVITLTRAARPGPAPEPCSAQTGSSLCGHDHDNDHLLTHEH